jgi:formamidopyrimidine-DNA glycosylase
MKMLELPEAFVIAAQLNRTVQGKIVKAAAAGQSPHKFAWYHGEPEGYGRLLQGKKVGTAVSRGGLVELAVEDCILLFGDGVALRYHGETEKKPVKHQLLVEFEDASALSASVQMYGGLWCFHTGDFQNSYYEAARHKPSPLGHAFDWGYYSGLYAGPEVGRLSAKAFLATEQRIPGLGNGVLQDILYNAGIHPRSKVRDFSDEDRARLYTAIKTTLHEMTALGGRDTERDLFGVPGGYRTKASKYTVNRPCPACGGILRKEAYMGGSIYYCSGCQEPL